MKTRLAWGAALVVPALALPLACSSEDSNPAASGGDGGVKDVEGADVEFVVTPSPDLDASLEVVDVADTPCGTRGGTERVLYTGASGVPGFVTTARVGARRMAGTIYDGFALFDVDGANPSATLLAPMPGATVSGSTGSRVLAAWQDTGKYVTAQYDLQGTVAVTPRELAAETGEGLALGGGEDVGLAVWGASQSVRARGIASTGDPAGAAFDLIAPGVASGGWTGAVAFGGQATFGVAWAGGTDGDHRVYFVTTSTTARNALPRRLVTATTPTAVAAVARTKAGWAVLARFAGAVHLMFLDATGKPLPPARRLLGTAKAIGLASIGDEVAVLAAREVIGPSDGDGGPTASAGPFELRPFAAATGEPLGGWVCMGTTPVGDVKAAIDADGTGYAVVQRTSAGALSLVRTDHLGTGAP